MNFRLSQMFKKLLSLLSELYLLNVVYVTWMRLVADALAVGQVLCLHADCIRPLPFCDDEISSTRSSCVLIMLPTHDLLSSTWIRDTTGGII